MGNNYNKSRRGEMSSQDMETKTDKHVVDFNNDLDTSEDSEGSAVNEPVQLNTEEITKKSCSGKTESTNVLPDINSNTDQGTQLLDNAEQIDIIAVPSETPDDKAANSISAKSQAFNVEDVQDDDSGEDSDDDMLSNLFHEPVNDSIEVNSGPDKQTHENETRAELAPGSTLTESHEVALIGEVEQKKDTGCDEKDASDNENSDTVVKSESAAEMEIFFDHFMEEHSSDNAPPEEANKYQFVVEKINQSDNDKARTKDEDEDEDFCCICLDKHEDPKILHKCSHKFCTACIDTQFRVKPVCPVCFVAYGIITGNQPEGHMTDYVSKKTHLPGYDQYDTIVVHYSFGDGIQKEDHPNPGQMYYGTSRTAYLPNNPEGQKVLRLLKASFQRRLTFTVGRSRTTGCDNVVTWNDVHHKTSTCGGMESFGYPDPTYLQRVQEELACRGVTEESLKEFPYK